MVPTSTFRVPDDFFMTRQLAKEPHQLANAKKCTTPAAAPTTAPPTFVLWLCDMHDILLVGLLRSL